MAEIVGSAVVVAAGGSTRMGRSKPLLPLCGRTLVEWHVDRLSRVGRVVVVVGFEADRVAALLGGTAIVVENADWARTSMVESVALGLRAFAGAAVVTPVDAAPVRSDVLDALLGVDGDAVPVDREGRSGHPIRLSGATADLVRTSPPDGGMRVLLGAATRVLTGDPDLLLDADDPETWEGFAKRWQPG